MFLFKFLSLYSICDRWMKTENALLVEWYWQGKDGSTWRRSCPSPFLSTTNPLRNGLELQEALRGKTLATNQHRQHGTAFAFLFHTAKFWSHIISFLVFISTKKMEMFTQMLKSNNRSALDVFETPGLLRTELSFVLILLASCQQACMTYTIAVCTVKNSWWCTEEPSETCRVLFQK